MMNEYDAVIIGSGFGGAVTAYKLAMKGHRVCILERGPQWTGEYFPGSAEKDVYENVQEIISASRLIKMGHSLGVREELRRLIPRSLMEELYEPPLWEYRWLKKMDVLTANGVGGGSLIYANVLCRAHKEAFQDWPQGMDWASELERHYDEVEGEIGTNIGIGHDKSRALEIASKNSGKGQWKSMNLAIQKLHDRVTCQGTLDCAICHPNRKEEELKAARAKACEKEKEEGLCMSCGRCVLGCKRLNKRTLDLNYIRRAVREKGAHLYPNHEVTGIKPLDNGYLILCDEQERAFKAKMVVIAAGTLGSTKLLLRCKKEGTLPNLSDKTLGTKFSGNGDFQGFAYNCNIPVNSSIGPTITSGIDFNPKTIMVEEGGIPDVLAPLAQAFIPPFGVLERLMSLEFTDFINLIMGQERLEFKGEDVTKKSIMFLCMGRDGAYGKIRLSGDDIDVDWDEEGLEKLEAFIGGLETELRDLSAGIGGTYFPNPLWRNPLWDKGKLVTVHPLGGCPMGLNEKEGVVKPNGEVFGHDNLYVADGSIIPAALGVNPSLTIAALANRIAENIPAKTF